MQVILNIYKKLYNALLIHYNMLQMYSLFIIGFCYIILLKGLCQWWSDGQCVYIFCSFQVLQVSSCRLTACLWSFILVCIFCSSQGETKTRKFKWLMAFQKCSATLYSELCLFHAVLENEKEKYQISWTSEPELRSNFRPGAGTCSALWG